MQIKAHLILFQKGSEVYVAKVHTLGDTDQNVDLLAKMPKIIVFRASSTGIFEYPKFFRKNFSLGI